MSMILFGITGFFIVALLAMTIYLYVYTFQNIKSLNNSVLEIKSKIGSMIRDINNNNKKEFTAEMEQQKSINNIVSMLG
jgi:low affinity Fe/Cu permease